MVESVETTVHENALPPGMKELVSNHFAPGTRGTFEIQTNLPLLRSTNSTILKHQNSKQESSMSVQQEQLHSTNGNGETMRRSTIATAVYDDIDFILIEACWNVILSFMGNRNKALEESQDTESESFESTKFQKRKTQFDSETPWSRLSNRMETLMRKKRWKRPRSMPFTTDNEGNAEPQTDPYFDDKLIALPPEILSNVNVLEKIQFLCEIGLENNGFRDEIYCQILKQLVFNPTACSSARGWILLSLVTGCFLPSDKILIFVKMFLEHQSTASSVYCLEKLSRTLQNGERRNPPCSLELLADKSCQKIPFPVICMDHSVRTIWADSAITSKEMCEKLASKNCFADSFGFALYISLNDKLVLLGNGGFHVMDAVSQAETFCKINNVHERWRIYYRREYFSFSDACCLHDNYTKIWLTYSQICGGVQSGEYHGHTPQDLALMLAHQYCIRYGLDQIEMKKVAAVCEQRLPTALCNNKKDWFQMVFRTLEALSNEAKSRSNVELDTLDIMRQVVRYGSKAFIDKFTKSFFLSTFQPVTEKSKCVIDAILNINHHQMSVCRSGAIGRISPDDGDGTILLEVSMSNLKSVKLQAYSDDETADLRMSTSDGKSYIFGSPQAEDIFIMLQHYIDERFSNNNELISLSLNHGAVTKRP